MALITGFGVMLALLAVSAWDTLRVLAETQAGNARIHRDFLRRERTLEQIRASLHLSGSVVRDYLLLDPGQGAAEALRGELRQIRDEMDAALLRYAGTLRPDEKEPFERFSSEVDSYWAVLNPVFEWDAEAKRSLAYWFVRQELYPRRASVLKIARSITAVNEQTLKEGEREMAGVFQRFRQRLRWLSGIALGLGLVVALLTITYTLRLERRADLRYQETLQARNELKELSARLLEVQEQERRAISRELHDGIGQSLSALLMDAGNLLETTSNGPHRRRLESIRRLAEDSVGAVRNMALLLRPSMLDDLGLVAALEWQAREVSKRTGLRVAVVEENVPDQLPEDHRTCIYRVVQEALHNTARHARAQNARVVLRQEPGRLLLTIQDDGAGFDAGRIKGLGLLGMAERVTHLGGDFRIESEPGRGVLVRAELPLPANP
jgi:signal transduction histidine kinase